MHGLTCGVQLADAVVGEKRKRVDDATLSVITSANQAYLSGRRSEARELWESLLKSVDLRVRARAHLNLSMYHLKHNMSPLTAFKHAELADSYVSSLKAKYRMVMALLQRAEDEKCYVELKDLLKKALKCSVDEPQDVKILQELAEHSLKIQALEQQRADSPSSSSSKLSDGMRNRLQKMLALQSRGGTEGERQAAGRNVERLLTKFGACKDDIGMAEEDVDAVVHKRHLNEDIVQFTYWSMDRATHYEQFRNKRTLHPVSLALCVQLCCVSYCWDQYLWHIGRAVATAFGCEIVQTRGLTDMVTVKFYAPRSLGFVVLEAFTQCLSEAWTSMKRHGFSLQTQRMQFLTGFAEELLVNTNNIVKSESSQAVALRSAVLDKIHESHMWKTIGRARAGSCGLRNGHAKQQGRCAGAASAVGSSRTAISN